MLVVNMSLSGTEPSAIEESAFQAAWDAGVLPVAVAGNGGSSAMPTSNSRLQASASSRRARSGSPG